MSYSANFTASPTSFLIESSSGCFCPSIAPSHRRGHDEPWRVATLAVYCCGLVLIPALIILTGDYVRGGYKLKTRESSPHTSTTYNLGLEEEVLEIVRQI